MADIVERLRIQGGGNSGYVNLLCDEAADEIERLQAERDKWLRRCEAEEEDYKASITHWMKTLKRLRAALKRIVDEAESDDGLTAWDGADIAREALK